MTLAVLPAGQKEEVEQRRSRELGVNDVVWLMASVSLFELESLHRAIAISKTTSLLKQCSPYRWLQAEDLERSNNSRPFSSFSAVCTVGVTIRRGTDKRWFLIRSRLSDNLLGDINMRKV